MLYIFDKDEKLVEVLQEGSFFDDVHREVLNGENTFVFIIPSGNEFVVEGNLVAFQDLDSYWQVFEIKRLVDVHEDGLSRTVYCEHIFYELLDDIVTDKRPSAGAAAALAGMLENTRWQVGVVDDLGTSRTNAYYVSVLKAVQNVANAWAGELRWRCVITGGVITRYVDLLAMRGADTGKQFVYDKDTLKIEREVDLSGVFTALYGRGKGVETESGSYGRRLTFADIEAADKVAGQEWVGNNDALARWGRPGGRHRFGIFTDEEETDAAKLLEKTRAELEKCVDPRVTYRLDVIVLEQMAGYAHEAVRLGDMVRVIDRKFVPELVVSARIIEVERNRSDPFKTKIVLGNFAPTILSATINTAQRLDSLANRPYNTKWLDGAISVLQNAIENTQAYVFETPQGTLHLNAPTYEEATEAMLLGGGRFAIANQKDGEGGWNWRTFGDGAGFTADLITTGLLAAELVQVGHATTFEEGYDPSKSKAIGMAADSNCTGLWHLDGNLNSHKGNAAEFDGDFLDSKWGQGASVVSPAIFKILNEGIVNPLEASINMRIYDLAIASPGSKLLEVPGSPINELSNAFAVKVEVSADAGHEGELSLEDAGVQTVYVEGSGLGSDFADGVFSDVEINVDGSLAIKKVSTDYSYAETSEADFGTGVLSQVVVKSDGSLQLDVASSGYSADLTGSGTPLSGGDNGSSTKDKAFDNSESTNWQASQIGAGINGVAYIGYDFGVGVTKHIRRVRVKSSSSYTSSVKLQYSDNGTSWTDVQTLAFTSTASWYTFDITSSGAHRYWRLLANANAAVYWALSEIELMELLPDTHYASGYREITLDISGKDATLGSKIEWNTTTPANTAVQIQVALSTDGGSTYGSYQNCTSGSAIPGISGANLANARLKIKESLFTADTVVTPALNDLAVNLYAGYKTSGYWEMEFDYSQVGIVGSVEGPLIYGESPTGSTTVLKAAVSTDGGVNYGSYQVCSGENAIPGIITGMSSTGLWIKFKVELSTNDPTATPTVAVIGAGLYSSNTKVYGIDISELTGYDNIAIQWKSDRLSLIINGVEEAYIENPNQIALLGDYTYIGCDASGSQIGTVIDELRIDNIYQPLDKVNAWCLVDSPFYTSEEFKQWPGYVRVETDGVKVHDSESALRVLLGSWMSGAIRKYGLKIFDGEIYSSIVRSGAEDADDFIQFNPPNSLEIYGTTINGAGYKVMSITAPHSTTANYLGGIQWYSEYGSPRGGVYNEDNNVYITAVPGDVITSSLVVFGDKNCVEYTDDFGAVKLAARESPDVRYIDEGLGELNNGECRVDLDPIFMQCIEPNTSDNRWFIHVTPYADVSLYISEIGEDYFIVKESGQRASSGMSFAWSLSAVRKNRSMIRFMEVIK